jgi:hypothetical protein
MSNHKGALVQVLLMQAKKQYLEHLMRKEISLSKLISLMPESMSDSSSSDEATMCLLQHLCKNFEGEFIYVATISNVTMLKKKMDAAQVEAMLQEAHITN